MKGGNPPSMASFGRQGRGDARSLQLLERIQARNAERLLTRRREAKPALLRVQERTARVLVLQGIPIDGDYQRPTPPVEAVRFEGTGRVSRRAGGMAAAAAAALLALITPSLGLAQEPTGKPDAGIAQIKPDNPFGFVEGKTRVEDVGRLLGAKGVGDLEWVLDTHAESGRTTLLVVDGVKALYAFDGKGLYFGCIFELNNLASPESLDFSRTKNWTLTVGYLGRRFATAENFLARMSTGVLAPAILMLDADQKERKMVAQTIDVSAIVKDEGGFRNPRLLRRGRLILLHADKADGKPWANVYGFSGSTGQFLGAKPAEPELSMVRH